MFSKLLESLDPGKSRWSSSCGSPCSCAGCSGPPPTSWDWSPRSSSVNTMAALTIKRSWWKGTSRTSWRTTRTSSPTPRSTTERTRPPLLRSCPSTLKRKSLRRTWISVEVDDFKDANEALENQVEVCNDDFEDEDLKALEDEDEGQRINAFDAVYLSPSTLSSNGFLS